MCGIFMMEKIEIVEVLEDQEFVPVIKRPEWQDADILALRERYQTSPKSSRDRVVHIDVEQDLLDLMYVLYDRIAAQEVSWRVMDLTEAIIVNVNSANYSVWQWRWKCFEEFATNSGRYGAKKTSIVQKELNMMKAVAIDNPKNYQLWNHRRKFSDFRGNDYVKDELEFSQACLDLDGKNYHAWAHRQAVIRMCPTIELLGYEEAFTKKCLLDDVYNNSAWNQRFFILSLCEKHSVSDVVTWDGEVEKTIEWLQLNPDNESGWEYLKSIALKRTDNSANAVSKMLEFSCLVLESNPHCLQAALTLAETYSMKAAMVEGEETEHYRTMAAKIGKKLEALDPLGSNRYSYLS